MQQKQLLSVFIGIVVVGAIVFIATRPATDTTPDTSTSESTEFMPTSQQGTLAELARLGDNFTCTVRHEDSEAGTTVVGTAYIADGGERMSGTYQVTMADGTTMESNIIRTDGWNYMWGDQFDSGVKTQVDESDLETMFPEDSEDNMIDPNLVYNCEKWRVDEDVFTVPSTVTFIDYSAQMMQVEAAASASANVQSQQCAACDMIPDGDNKAACLQALGC